MENEGALRLLFRHQGVRVTLEAAIPVQVRPLRSKGLDDAPVGTHFYYELQSHSGGVLHRRWRSNPLGRFFEVPTHESSKPFHYRSAAEDVSGYFSVLVPRIRGARFVELFASVEGQPAPAVSVGRFDVDSAPSSWTPPGRSP